MAYTKTNWIDRLVQYPNRYTKTNESANEVTLTASPGTITESGTPLNASNLNKIETGIESATPIVGQTSTDTSGWTATTTAGFTQKKDVAITGVTADDYPSIFFVAASYVAAKDAGITFVESYAGGITLYGNAVPASTLTFDYVVAKG